LDGLGCSCFSRSRSAQSPSILFNILSSNASADAVGIRASELTHLAALAEDLSSHVFDLSADEFGSWHVLCFSSVK
jgi:hypothetical protein